MDAAELLFIGGGVFVGEGTPLRGYSVAVTGGRIVAVVPDADAIELTGPSTEIIPLNNALLSPAFQDAHVHPIGGGMELLQCNLSDADSAADTFATIAAHASTSSAEWITGGGWTMSHFEGGAPTRSMLDAIVPDRPALFSSRDHHSVWANTVAIERAGIDRRTPDPSDGRIEREADGYPAGTFQEGAERLFDAVRPVPTEDDAYRALLRAQDELLALGVTGWQDAMIGPGLAGIADPSAVYARALDAGTLQVHVVGAQWWERHRGLEQVAEMIERRECWAQRYPRGQVALTTAKIMVDGVAENHTAAMLSAYRDGHGGHTDNYGLSFLSPDILADAVTQLDAAGMQVHFHALGDRAVREALDAVSAARQANGPSDGRHHLAHIQVIAEPDVARFRQLHAVANMQALWATHEDQLDELTLPFLAEGQEARQYPFGDLTRAGVRLAAGSDWPVSSANPLAAIHIAVTRVAPEIAADPLGGPHQRLDLATALAAYTSGSAYVNHRDLDTGRIQRGYRANLVVIDPDPFLLEPADIHRATVTSTWIDGRPVHTRR